MKKSILLISLAVLPLFGYSQNVLPDWALGGFVRPEKANPIITPNPSNQFDCPMQDKKIGWEESDVFNPAATVKDGKIYVLYRAEDNSATGIGKRTSRIGLAESEDGIHMKRRKTPVMYPDKDNMKEYEWEGGCEDPRVTMTEDGLYVMAYTSWNRKVRFHGDNDQRRETSADENRWKILHVLGGTCGLRSNLRRFGQLDTDIGRKK